MTRDIGKMDTPPYGTPIQPMADEDTPVEIPAQELRRATSENINVAEDIIVLGRLFAKPRTWLKPPDDYFHHEKQTYLGIAGGAELNNLFVEPYREVTTARTQLHEFHSIVGRLGACYDGSVRAHFFSIDPNKWHNVLLKSFFLDMFQLSNRTAGETLARIWSYMPKTFLAASSHLRTISARAGANNHSKAAALRVFGHAAPFFAKHQDADREKDRLDTDEHLEFFQRHQNPLVSSAATFSIRALSGVIR